MYRRDGSGLLGKSPGSDSRLIDIRELQGAFRAGIDLDLTLAALNQDDENDDEQNTCNYANDGGCIHACS